MRHMQQINFGNFLLSLSDMMDLISPRVAQHQQRVAYIVWSMGREAGLGQKEMETLFIAALLHDIGALSPEERIALHEFEVTDTQTHALRGESLLRVSPLLLDAAGLVRNHHRDWNSWDTSIDDFVVFGSQCIFIADYVERLIDRNAFILQQSEGILTKLRHKQGYSFHPDIVALVEAIGSREEFWLDLSHPHLYSLLLHHGPFRTIEVTLTRMKSITRLFTCVIDFRSRFTATHSSGVAACAEKMAELFGLSEREVTLMKIAGDLHDLGKLAVPNAILEKPGRLTKEEFTIIKSHTYYTYTVLNTIKGFHTIGEIAAFHHEKLDGSGYPFHCISHELCSGARIMMVADIFTALAEDRPYREGMDDDKIREILRANAAGGGLDARIVDLLCDNYDEIKTYVRRTQIDAYSMYERLFPR